MMNFVAILGLLLVSGNAVLAENTYSVYVPKYIRPGVEYSIDVEILDYDGSVDVEAELKSDDFQSSATATVVKGSSFTLSLGTLPYGYEGSKKFTVSVVGKNTENGEEIFKDSTSDLEYQNKFLSIFIETDKAIYKPGQTIKFRAAVTTPDLLPYQGNVSYKLQDPNGNIILREEEAELVNGVAGSHFKLGRYSTQGDWKITYGVHGYEESLTVSVEEYTLPKFSAEIKTDQTFLHPGSQALTGEIKATYTFGQPVKGTAVVEFTINKWWGRNRIPPKIVVKFPEFDGTGQFSIDAKKIEDVLEWNPKQWSQPISIFASVTEKNTGEKTNETTTVDLHRVKMKIETLAKPEHIKPGLPYVAYLKISQQDGSLLSAEDMENLRVEIESSYSYTYNWRLAWNEQKPKKVENTPVEVGADGLIIFKTIASSDDFNRVDFQVKIPSYPDQNQYWTSWSAERFKSPSDTFLQVSTDDTSLSVNETAELTICTTKKSPTETYRISLVARGKVIKSVMYTPSSYNDTDTYFSFTYSFVVETDYSPSVYAVVSFVCDGEFIADTVKINVQAALKHQVTMTTSTDSTDAGQPISITVRAEADSYVGLRAIDQSVLLLKSGNDITQAKIFQDLDEYGPRSRGGFWPRWGGWWWPWSVGGGDVSEVFENSGFIILTDGVVYKSQPDYVDYFDDYEVNDGPVFALGRPMAFEVARVDVAEESLADSHQSAPVDQGAPKTRSYFPESWIWTDDVARDDGSVTFNYNTPDTITTWEISTFAMSDNKGLGVPKETSKITVFRNFFISLNLPASIVRGEILAMKTTLFNYFDMEITATLTLEENEWYDLVIPGDADPMMAGATRTVVIPSKDSATVVFPIRFKKAGNARISVKAQTALAGDAVERVLLVKPEGIPKIASHSSIIDRPDKSEPASQVAFSVDIPDDAVEGSVYVKFSVSGNVLGSALSNLGSLLKMPSGCGEQTMLSFAPDVYVSLYLKKVGELKGEVKQKSQDHIREGYNNELRYQRDDGSFSAFGSSDRSGSTWLTAFVAKCFIAANELNPVLIEESKIRQAIDFILKQQNDDGTFKEPGRVIHKDMQGGVDSDETTAAYMLIALTEGSMFKKDNDVAAAVAKTQKYLEGRIENLDDIYTLSIVGYALSLVGSAEAGKVLNIIDSKVVTEENVKYWKKEETGVAKCDAEERYCPFDANKPSSSSIEITAYVLLTYIKVGRIDQVMPIVRWLVQQRGAFGGYHSTQDTVMAIQALATVAGFFSDRPTDLDITVAHDGKADFTADFEISDDNAIILQMAELPSLAGTVSVTATGEGVGDVQVTVAYNLPVGPRSDEPFVLDVKLEKTIRETTTMEVCSRINEDRKEVIDGTGMFVITFTLPSGCTIDDKKATKDNHQAKLIELEGEEVTGYFDELPKGQTICMTLELIKYAEVAGMKPKVLVLYDYYKPQIQSMRMIEMDTDEDICSICGSACVGCSPTAVPIPGIVEPGEPPLPPKPCCGPSTYPCPDFYDGLYYDSGSHVMKMISKYDAMSTCKAPNGAGDSSTYTGLPASLFDGVNQYIECSGTPWFDAILRSDEGFTISIVVSPSEMMRDKYYSVFSIGSSAAKRPYVIFAKRPRSSHYWFKILLNGYQVIVRSIFSWEIPIDDWTMITVRGRSNEADVFLNGVKKGKRLVRKQDTEEIAGEVTMKVGRSHIGGKGNRGNWKGLVSNLDVWSKWLDDEEMKQHYNCYKDVISAQNPELSLPMVHHVVPQAIRHCFTKSEYSSDMKSRVGELTTACDAPNGPKPVDN